MTGKQEKETSRLFHEGLELLAIQLPEEDIYLLVRYCLELKKWNKKVNLVARNTSLPDLIEKHFLDSLTMLSVLQKYGLTDGTLLDVGTGAGFPGMVLKIACPSLGIVLLEPRQRRVSFLNYIIRSLSMKNIRVIMDRIEESNLLLEYEFSIITSRAVADIQTFLPMISNQAGKNTVVVCMQGEGGKQQIENQGLVSGFTLNGIEEFTLPFSAVKRYLLLFGKSGS